MAYGKNLDFHLVDICDPSVLDDPTKFLITNNLIVDPIVNPNRYQMFPDSWYGMYAGAPEYQPQSPTWNYNCFINRMDTTRQSWLYLLVRRNVFDQGLVSFNMDISKHILFGQVEKTAIPAQVFEDQYQQYMTNFVTEHEYVKHLVPYKNFDDTDLNGVIMQTKFSIVLETHFDQNYAITYSEKIFRCLKLPRPWVLYGMKNSVSNLRRMGFDVLDDIVDHSYDSIDNHIIRQSKILDQVPALSAIEFTPSLNQRLTAAADHNQSILDHYKELFVGDVDATFKTALEKCKTT